MSIKDTSLVTSASGRVLKIRVVSSGQGFASVGQVIARNGVIIAESEPCPCDMTTAALAKARALAEAL